VKVREQRTGGGRAVRRVARPARGAALGAAFALAASASGAQDAAAGRQKAQACTVCHGPLGLSTAPDAPNLAGQPAIYLVAQLRAYRDGSRRHEVMAVIARPLSDEDIRQLAAWFASVRVEAAAP
jgi:cytochrome c553